PIVQRKLVSGYINNVRVQPALSQLALNNDLELTQKNGLPYLGEAPRNSIFGYDTQNENAISNPGITIRKTSEERVDVRAEDVSALELIRTVASELDLQYYVLEGLPQGARSASGSSGGNRNNNNRRQPQLTPPGQQSRLAGNSGSLNNLMLTLQARDATFKEILQNIFRNSDFTYELRDGIFLIGYRASETLRRTEIVQFQFRSARGMAELVPEFLTEGVLIDTLYELNSLILSGSRLNIEETKHFLKSLDRVVPMVNIEMTIVDISTSKLDQFGVEAGVTPGGREAGGSIVSSTQDQGGVDFTFSPNAINQVLDLLAGRGVVNIGRVTPDFYLSLKALQEDGVVDIESTPKLSTLNSHPAQLSIGTKRYYQEQQVNFPGLQQPIPVQATIFKEIEANLLININPIVSGDEEVTLDIYFEQSEFLEEAAPNAPPPQVSRRFESMIRVRNGETVVLGGLERKATSRTRRGVPFLSKIPLIGWIFGSKRKSKQKDKLIIFIKPTIIN
ncbi:MAG: hypothetical protein AAFU67_14180, partial [Bacteroidota bacterium]